MRKEADHLSCCWQGRRLAWWIAVGYSEFMTELRDGTSQVFQEALADASNDHRSGFVEALQNLANSLIEEFVEKFASLFHPPYNAIGAYYCVQGGPVSRSQELLKDCIDEVDMVIAAGNIEKLNRVARTHFVPFAPPRELALQFIDAVSPALEEYPLLYVILEEMALTPFAERRIEKVHALIKKAGSYCFGISVAQLCAKVRESRHLVSLKNSFGFYEFC